MTSIFIVNLLRDGARRRYICDQLERFDLEYEFFEAVDKNRLTARHYALYDDAAVHKRVGRSLSEGEIACALSHAAVWELALQRGDSRVVILEDDAELSDDFEEVIKSVERFPADWDMLNFCTTAPQEPTGIFLPSGQQIGGIPSKMSGTVAYCANQQGLRTMLKYVFPLKAAADGLLSSLAMIKYLKCYGTSPQIVKPSEQFNSSIWQSSS